MALPLQARTGWSIARIVRSPGVGKLLYCAAEIPQKCYRNQIGIVAFSSASSNKAWETQSEETDERLASNMESLSFDASTQTPLAYDSLDAAVTKENSASNASEDDQMMMRQPRNVQAVYLRPLKRKPEYGLPSCDLQLRSYNARNVEFFADFALRAAYYLNLPASGPVPLPKLVERWTVPRSNFIFKKSQENFERITLRRLIQIKDGNPETVEIWLAFLRKHAYYGVGMKANIWEYEKLGVGGRMDAKSDDLKKTYGPRWAHFGRKKNANTTEKVLDLMNSETFQSLDEHSA